MRRSLRILREPVLHFLLLGALAFAAWPERRPEVRVSPAELAALADAFRSETGREPNPEERETLLARAIDERILLAEAFRLGLDRNDTAVATRLARIGSFVADAPPTRGADAAARARALGLDSDDVVIRRYLAERMRQRLARGADRTPPSRAELEAHVRAHPERFALPERIAFRHVFLRDAEGGDPARMQSLEVALSSLPLERAARLGDPFPRSRRMNASREAIARAFGPAFLAALDPTRTQRWQGPIPSSHGIHYVFVESLTGRELPDFEAVRARAEQELLAERRAERLARRLAELRAHYAIALP